MSVPLRLVEKTVGGVVVLQLHGHLVFDEGDRVLRDRVHELTRDGRTSILVDLSDVSYIDSGGIGALVQLFTELTAMGGRLKLLHPSWASARVLQITHLTSVFEIFDDEATALDSMRGNAAARVR